MTARLIQAPVHGIDCDGCGLTFTPAVPFNQRTHGRARIEASAAGWKVRPPRGPDAKTAPDLCPACPAAKQTPHVVTIQPAGGVL